METIRNDLYSESSHGKTPSELFQISINLHHELRRWRAEMPSHLMVN